MSDYPPVVAMAEMTSMLGISRSRLVQLLVTSEFPDPIATLTVGRIWSTTDIEAYAQQTGRTLQPIPAR
ncbi:MAG TPA: DNA-binding protein [Pedococcus sp.]|nr:DNA-binding protein [Pedococcus sp.]